MVKPVKLLRIRWPQLLHYAELYEKEVLERAEEHAACFPEVRVWIKGDCDSWVTMRRMNHRFFVLSGGGLFVLAGDSPLTVEPECPLMNAARGEHEELWEPLFEHSGCRVPDRS